MSADNMSNINVSPDVLLTLMLLQQDDLYKLQEQILHGISRSSRPEVFCDKAIFKRCFPVNFAKFLRPPNLKSICERLLLYLKYYTPPNNTAEPVAQYS